MKKLLSVLFFFCFLFSILAQDGNVLTVTNIAQLQTVSPFQKHSAVHVAGYYLPGDGGGGLFVKTNSVSSTNLGTRLASTVASGWSWQRVYDGPVDPKWFGVTNISSGLPTANYSDATNFTASYSFKLLGTGTFQDPQTFNSGVTAGSNFVVRGPSPWVDVRAYGSNDDTALASAVAVANVSGKTKLFLGAGSWTFTTGVTITNDGVHIVGAGKRATLVTFAPTVDNSTLFKFQRSDGGVCYEPSIRGMYIAGSGTNTKTAINFVDTSDSLIDEVVINFWTGGGISKGIKLNGRELTRIANSNIRSDMPLSIEDNPNSSLDCDHLYVRDTSFASDNTTNYLVTVASGVYVSNMGFENIPLVGGAGGVKWDDSTSVGQANGVRFSNIRYEQPQGANTNWNFYIRVAGGSLNNLMMENIYCSGSVRGLYLESITRVQLNEFIYSGATLLGLQATNVGGISTKKCLFQPGSTANLGTNLVLYTALNRPNSSSPIEDDGEYGPVFPNTPPRDVGNTTATSSTTTAKEFIGRSSGTPAENFGVRLLLKSDSASVDDRDMTAIDSIWTTATDASRASAMLFYTLSGGGSLTESFRAIPTGLRPVDGGAYFLLNGKYHIGPDSSNSYITKNGNDMYFRQSNGGGFIMSNGPFKAENDAIIGSTSDPGTSAKLQIDSTTKGLLPPRMTKAQRNAISSPANGLIIYQTDNTPGTREYRDGAWVILNATADP